MFMILGTVLITGLVGIISYFILNAYGDWRNILFDTIGPYLIILGLAIIITILFNDIFDIAADTMLHCYVFE